MSQLFLPAPYRPSSNSIQNNCQGGVVDIPRPMMHTSLRPFQRMASMVPPVPHFARGVGPAPFSPISPSPYGMDGGPPPFGGPHGMPGHGLQRPGMGGMGFPPHNTLKQLLQHQQGHPPGHQQQMGQQFPQHPPHQFPHQHHHPPQQQLQLQIQQQQQQPPPQQPQNNSHSNLPECHSLIINIVLGDSMLNIFRDHNFDSCTVCVCSDGQNWVGTIRGQDAVFYLPESSSRPPSTRALTGSQHHHHQQQQQQFPGMGGMGPGFMPPPPTNSQEEESCRCNCGFSALVNRHLAHQAGLFYEDEVEIVGAQSTRDPGQFKRGSLYAFCHSTDKQEQSVLMRSRMLECGLPVGSDANGKPVGKGSEKEVDKGDIISSTIAAVVMEASAPLVDTLPVALMELLREQCLLLHHSSSPLYRAEQLQAATRKASILHALDLSDGCETARNALTLALYNNTPPPLQPLASPMHPQQPPPPPYQQHQQQQQTQQQQQQQQHWNNGPQTPNPYGMPFPGSGMVGGFQAGGVGTGFQGNPNMHHPMSPSLHSPTMPVRGRPPTPAAVGMPMAMSSPVGMAMQRPPTATPTTPAAPAQPAGSIVHYWPFLHVQGPNSSQDVIRVMRTLQPLLQDSIQKKRAATLWRAPFAVQGPLTWRQFHRMAVRGNYFQRIFDCSLLIGFFFHRNGRSL